MTGGRKRIVIATLGSLGDLHPYMAVALRLRSRGHDVILAATPSYRSWVEAAGPPSSANPLYEGQHSPTPQALGRRALLLVGKEPSNRSNLSSPLPNGVAVSDYAPCAAVFGRAAAVVHQGGVGTVAQALRAGVPSLVVPFNFDQPDNAARIARIGAGRVLSRAAYTGSTAADALEQLLNNREVSQQAQSAAEVIASEHGADVACDALARL